MTVDIGLRVSAPAPRGGGGWPVLPGYGPGQAIGLLGGSFNPPHRGHLHISELAIRRLGLDHVWWLVTPGNPLKSRADLAPLDARIAAARSIAANPRIKVTALEVDIGTSRTRDTLRFLTRRASDARLVWLMGADNLAGFHRWYGWQEIAALVPIAVFDRPGWAMRALASPAAQRLARYRLRETAARGLAGHRPPSWVFLHSPHSPLSSTALRAKNAHSPHGVIENVTLAPLS